MSLMMAHRSKTSWVVAKLHANATSSLEQLCGEAYTAALAWQALGYLFCDLSFL